MKSTSETGHAKNIANFQDLIAFCQDYGDQYNPTNADIQITKMQALLTDAQQKLEETKTLKTTYEITTNDRRNAFAELKTLATKITNAFQASGADDLAIQDIRTINKKIQGTQKPKTTESETPSTNSISTSQQSYDMLADHFATLIQTLEQYPSYNPNEEHLKIRTLHTKLTDLKDKNNNATLAFPPYSNAKIARNNTLYDAPTALLSTAKDAKLYIKSIFGAQSPQYKQVSKLQFKKIA